MTVHLILLIAAFVLFLIACFPATSARFNLIAAGLACWVLATLLGSTQIH